MKNRSYQPELLDAAGIPAGDLHACLRELNTINTYLGGHKAVEAGYRAFHGAEPLHIMEIGSGGGDNLGFLQKRFPKNTYTGLDLKQDCIDFAAQQNKQINWIASDYARYQPPAPYDVVFNSLFCHHFTDSQLVGMLKWMYKNSTKGFFIADLHRHPLAYHSIHLLTSLFSKSYLVRNDARLSVQRGFKKHEWEHLLQLAGISTYKIHWKWAFRHLIIVKK